MFKKIALGLGLLASVFVFTGCTTANTTRSEKMMDLSRIEKFVSKGTTNLSEVRELIGTPGITGKTIDGKDFVGFALVGQKSGAEEAGRFVASVLTLGIASDNEARHTFKSIFFVLDDSKIVQDIKYDGYAYIFRKNAFGFVSYCQRRLTDDELRDTTNYSKDYIINSWKKYVVENQPSEVVAIAKEENTTIDKLDYDDVEYKEFSYPDYLCLTAHNMFGDYTNVELNSIGGRQSNDGSKKALLGL